MLTCENCGVMFKQSGTQEVVSARVLCPDCVEKRRQEKAKRAEGQKAPAAAPVASAAARRAPAPAPASAPARTASKGSGVRSRREVVEEDVDDSPRGRRGRRGGGGSRSAADQAVRIGFMFAGALVLIAIGVYAYTSNEKAKREEAEAAQQKKVDDFMAEMRAYDPNVPADAEKIRERAEKDQALIPEESASEVLTMVGRATATLTAAKENEQLVKTLEEIEQTIAMAGNKTPDELAELRRRVDRSAVKGELAGKAIADRFKVAKRSAADAYAKKLIEDARAFVAANPAATGDALNRYKKAEDEVTTLYEKAGTDKDEEAKSTYGQMLKEIYSESNAICARAFTDAAVAQVPLKDLIAPGSEKAWTKSTVSGFDQAILNGALKLIGPDKATKSRGVMSVGDQEAWRDFVIDMTIERAKGKIEIFFRAGKNLDGTVLSYMLNDNNTPANTPTRIVASVIGGRYKITIDGAEAPVVDMDIPPAMRRKGAFAIAVAPETEATISKLGARVLR